MEWLQELTAKTRAYFRSLHPRQRTMAVVTTAMVLTLTTALWGAAVYDPMVVLFEQSLDAKTTTEVLTYLESNGIPHRMEPGTDRIYVPRSQKDHAAVVLRGSTLSSSLTSGMDIINNAPVGSTQFMERRRWMMALQSEIEAQINGFDKVGGSKVLLSIPEQALFTEDRVDPSASVYLELLPGRSLSGDEGRRIAAMVSSAVPRLSVERVEILDSELRVIHASKSGGSEYGTSDELADLRRQYDRYFQRKIERILERIVGPGKVVAQVSVQLDHSERQINQRELDGDRAVVISTRSREASSAGGNTAAVPGTTANIPEIQTIAEGATTRESSEEDQVANVDVPETLTRTSSLPGRVLGITASVVVDGSWDAATAATPAAGAAAPGSAATAPAMTYTARTPDELTEYKAIVASAIGTTAENVTIVNRPFAQLKLTPAVSGAAVVPTGVASWIPWTVLGLVILLIFLFVIRPAVLRVTTPDGAPVGVDPLTLVGGAVPEQTDPGGMPRIEAPDVRGADLADWLETLATGSVYVGRDDVTRLVTTDIDQSVYTLRSWLQDDER
ncbi:MAG: flagellar basal-body MS-ring/collar protein FliF [Myxococcota bacterium]|nr:flagellar basal-body MS-ring/collar protein FliF [Myxococcota bacterium]